MEHGGRCLLASMVLGIAAVAATPASAQKKYATGITDTEIKIGQTMPYSGPASAWGTIGRAELAYFKMINDQGGINGRKITLVSVDDSFSPPKTVDQTRKLIEQKVTRVDIGCSLPPRQHRTIDVCWSHAALVGVDCSCR